MARLRQLQKDEKEIDVNVNRLLRTARSIQQRDKLSASAVCRVEKAFELLRKGARSSSGKTAERERHYYQFLKCVQNLCGDQVVALSAIGIGQTTIGDTSAGVRSEVPSILEGKRSQLQSDALEDIVQGVLAKSGVSGGSQSWDEDVPLQPMGRHSTTSKGSLVEKSEQPSSLKGDVYELSLEDVKTYVMAEHVSGNVYLTDAYTGIFAFITIPISTDLKNQFVIHRPRVM